MPKFSSSWLEDGLMVEKLFLLMSLLKHAAIKNTEVLSRKKEERTNKYLWKPTLFFKAKYCHQEKKLLRFVVFSLHLYIAHWGEKSLSLH